MQRSRSTLRAAIVAVAAASMPAAARADCPPFVDFSSAPPVGVADLQSQATLGTKFDQRARATQAFSEQCVLDFQDSCKRRDIGQAFHHRLFAYLASADASKRQQAYDYLRGIRRDEFGAMGTTAPLGDVCETTAEDVLSFLPDLATNLGRHGEGDVGMIGLVTAALKFPMPDDVLNHVLSLIDETPTIGGVETVSFGLSTGAIAGICVEVCGGACGGGPIACAACGATCVAALEGETVDSPETENHLNNIYVAQYLANQKRFELTGDPKYDNSRNGYRQKMIARMRDFVRNDFIEYNAHPYQTYTMFALLALESFATDTGVQAAAKGALDYVSAKVAVSSNDLIRSTPFRRRDEPNHVCDDLFNACADPQTQFFFMLTGLTDLFGPQPPGGFAEGFGWVAASNYRLDPIVLDLFVDRSHRKFYQFFHYGRQLQFDGFTDSNDELYYGSPSFLLSAGGHDAHYAYTATVPFPIDALPFVGGRHPGSKVDLGRSVPTTLMPTGDPERSHARNKMISFHEVGGENMCVAPNFACGLNPNVPGDYPGAVPPGDVTAAGLDPVRWSVFDRHGAAGQPGYYVAVYRQDDWGFLEAYDTSANPQSFADVKAFMAAIHARNPTLAVTRDGTSSYTTVDGTTLRFMIDAHIVSINGVAPIRNRTNGDVIDNDGHGVVTIKNPGLPGRTLTLDATIPPDHPTISVPGPVHFPNTCVGSTSFSTLNVCNVSGGASDLFVYNILSKNTQFGATEPISGYPLTLGSNFCFPFQVQYSPKVTGPVSSSFTIVNSDPQQDSLRVDVTGSGIQQGIATVIANAGIFGNACVGSFVDLNLTINNTGGCDLVVTGLGSSSPDFLVAATLSFPLTIHAGGSIAVPIRYKPAKFGASTGNITVASNDPSSPTSVVAVVGNAPAPAVNASIVNAGDFGNVCAGTRSDIALQVMNQGLCPLTISSIGSTGASSFVLPSVTTFPIVLGANGSVMLPVRFQPAAFGSAGYVTCSDTVRQTATVVIHSDDPLYPDPAAFTRSVSAIEGCPRIVLSPQNLTGAFAFPATVSDPAGTRGCYTDRQITVANAGQCPLQIANLATTNVSLPAGSTPEFTVVNPSVPLTVAPGAAPVPITVRFRPVQTTGQLGGAPDEQTGTLSITSNDPVPADNRASLCGEPVVQSGARVLVVSTSNAPVASVASIALSSKGMTPPFSQTLKPATLTTAPSICGNRIQYHLDNETLRPAGTTGSDPRASYVLSAKNGSTSASASFTVGACEMKDIVLQLR